MKTIPASLQRLRGKNNFYNYQKSVQGPLLHILSSAIRKLTIDKISENDQKVMKGSHPDHSVLSVILLVEQLLFTPMKVRRIIKVSVEVP